MKTIFLTIFEGVEAKNIMRTPVLETLLADPETKLVFLAKNRERVDFYKKEFRSERIIYEITRTPKVDGLDKFFARLKFLLLKTRSTNLKRKMNLELNKNYFSYCAGLVLNWLFARPLIRKSARKLDFALVKSSIYKQIFDKYNPDLVFLSHLFDEREIHLLREAKKRKTPSIGFINSWDKVTARCVLRLLPDKAVVFNDIVKGELVKYGDMAPDDIYVAGIPHYDHYFTAGSVSKEVFFKRLKIPKNKKLIVYAPLGRSFNDSDWDMVDLLYSFKSDGVIKGVEILVRFQPNDFLDKKELIKRPYIKYDYPGVRFSSKRGVDWDMSFKDLDILRGTLKHMSLLICYASSMSIDAAVFGKPVININFELKKSKSLLKSPTQYFKSDHYAKALRSGGIKLVNSKAELINSINLYLDNPALDSKGREKLINRQCKFKDGRAGERLGKFILENIQ